MNVLSATQEISSEEHVASPTECRVLFVDDDEMFLSLCKRYLKKAELVNYHIDYAQDANDGMNKCLTKDYDCLVVDYRLPDATGTQMLETLKQNTLGKTVPPTIVLTAFGGQRAVTDVIRSDAIDFMVKSDVTRTSLVHAIENAQLKGRLACELQEKYEQLKQAYGELQDKSDEIKRFYHTVSHEIKTPVTAMREFVQLLSDEVVGEVNDDQRALLEYTSECCDMLVSHFNSLLDITRIDIGKISLNKAFHSPGSLIQFCVKGAQGLAREKQILLQYHEEPELPDCLLDARRFKQVLSNLIENAIKFTPNYGKVTVDTIHSKSDDFIEIYVRDTGCGISEINRAKVFERLYQVPQGSELEASTGGMGLGLSICREIVKLHQGEIVVQDTQGDGATFRIRLPVNAEPLESD